MGTSLSQYIKKDLNMNKEEIIEKYDLKIDQSIEIIDNEEIVTCRICGHQGGRLYGKHFNFAHNGISSKEYNVIFPKAPTKSLKDNKSTTKNGGKHMQTEKYKKMFSNMFSGENNPMHKSKTTEEFRKTNSPFSIEFYNKRYPEKSQEERQQMLHTFAKDSVKDRVGNTTIEFFIKQGLSYEEAVEALKDRQDVGRLDKFIERYGDEEGRKKWKERQEKWMKNYKKNNFSKISQKLFKSVYEQICNKYSEIYFATLNDNKEYEETGRNFEYRLELTTSYILPDFFIKDINKIIEFDGSYYHRKHSENVKRELKRDKEINENGYKVYHVKEDDYKKDPNKVLQECLDFINS